MPAPLSPTQPARHGDAPRTGQPTPESTTLRAHEHGGSVHTAAPSTSSSWPHDSRHRHTDRGPQQRAPRWGQIRRALQLQVGPDQKSTPTGRLSLNCSARWPAVDGDSLSSSSSLRRVGFASAAKVSASGTAASYVGHFRHVNYSRQVSAIRKALISTWNQRTQPCTGSARLGAVTCARTFASRSYSLR